MSIDLIVKLGLALAILVALIIVARWLYNRGQDRQALQETRERLKGESDAREREKTIGEAAKRVREAPGMPIPDLDELQRGAGGTPPPPGT